MKKIKHISLLVVFVFMLLASTNAQNNKKAKNKTEANRVKAERFFFSGLKENIKENYTEAINQFSKAVKLYPIDAAYYEISLIKYKQKDYSTAKKNIEAALKIEGTNKWYRELYAELLSIDGKHDKAASIYKKLREEYPANTNYYYSEAYFYLKQNKPKEAIKIYNALEKKIGINEDLTNEKYRLYIKMNSKKDAEKELVKLSEAFPKNTKFLNKLAGFYLSNNEEEKAIEIYKKILVENPNNAKVIMSLADYYNHIGDNEKYQEYSRKAFESEQINIDTKISILYDYIQLSKKDKALLAEAMEYAKILVSKHPEDAKSWAIYGDLYNIQEQASKALKMYNKSLEIRQDIFSVWQQVFFLQSDAKKYNELIKSTGKAKEYFPNQSLIYFFSGIANQQLKDYEKAIKNYKKGVKMAGKNHALKSQFFSNIAESYNSIKDFKNSDIYFEKCLEIEPDNQYTLNNYAYYLSLRAENLERAKEMSLKSLELSPNSATYLDTYAWILYKNKEYKKALEYQKRAIELSEKVSAVLYEHLGDIYYKLNKKTEALNNWKKAKNESIDINEKLERKIKEGKL